jgi:hypothetical protein
VASIKLYPNFIAALSIAIVGSMFSVGDPVKGMMPKFLPTRQRANDSTQEAFV